MCLGAVDLWLGETNKNTEIGLGPWTAVGRKLVELRVWVLLTYGSGKEIKTLNSGWALGLQWGWSLLSYGFGCC